MLLPQPQLMSELHFSIRGDVTVHPSAAIAPGVLLQADPGARLMIAAGVSIGAGSILHAYEGDLTIEVNACLGSGVLLVGSGKIGANACIGSMTTILNGCVESGQVIPPETLMGDRSRQLPSSESESSESESELAVASLDEGNSNEHSSLEETSSDLVEPEGEPVDSSEPNGAQSQPTQPDTAAKPTVYGLDAFNTLMASLFPHRQSLNQPLNQTTSALNQAPE
ncbi:transferase [Oscillatoria sp. FACHB-1407]|uniref:transferase n=1 Tax=Oscillatoria sp. FACHB-1407 TaxID=2692847 RepID=UPI0016873BC7|nr:transferase [Oscillatoria sp. FACHB-1407]MBD2462730.1 transferase [Oscillatoria sp. FACHB-1407]